MHEENRRRAAARLVEGMKQCSHCEIFRPLADYSPHKLGLGGVRSICKACSVAAVLAYRTTDAGRASHQRAQRTRAQTPSGRSAKAEANRRYAQQNPAKYLLIRARSRAKQKGVPCTITEADIVIPERCPITGARLVVAERSFRAHGYGGDDDSMSLDRIRPELGYVPGNVAVISWRANRWKGFASLEELERVVEWLRSVQTASSGIGTGGSAT